MDCFLQITPLNPVESPPSPTVSPYHAHLISTDRSPEYHVLVTTNPEYAHCAIFSSLLLPRKF